MDWIFDDSRPIWPQIKEVLTRDILTGKYQKGSSFPTVRDLAEEAGVNRNTMQRALAAMEEEGLLINNRTAGKSVTTDEELLISLRRQIGEDYSRKYLGQMREIGYDFSQTEEFLRELDREDDENE